jgi:Homeodomain-like domain
LRFCKASLYVHLIIMQSSNGQLLPQPNCPKPKRHNAKLCPFAIRQCIINALANGDSQRAIARALHVSNNTVAAIREQEWQQVAARKERIAAQCELNATLAAERMTDKLQGTDDIPLNTLVPALGVSVDKLAVLRGHAPSVNIANIWMPTEAEREERRQVHAKLNEIARRLAVAQASDAE